MILENNITEIQKLYLNYAAAVAYVAVSDDEGNEAIGSAFHIGDGLFVTAKHVIEHKKILEVATTKRYVLIQDDIQAGNGAETISIEPMVLDIIEGPYVDKDEDVAVFKVDTKSSLFPKVKISSHTSHEISDTNFVLSDALIIGYPPIPFTNTPNQVVATGQVNAVIDVRHSRYAHFVMSTMARGGFSGGVALSTSGFALGLVTESLGSSDSLVETGYMSVLSIDSAVNLSVEYFSFDLIKHRVYRDEETLIEVKMVNDKLGRLNSRLYNACVYVYDNDRDVYMEFVCNDGSLLQPAYEIFNAIIPIHKIESMSKKTVLISQPLENPPASLLVEAAEAVRDFFLKYGYRELSSKKNQIIN
ncbi:S1 family peptidase [Desulfoluna butyratoxydans]|uniref:Peptidase s1 pa clan n=1 Tax=Desulfoluna butyratoxydans TaxID=231438 RepID=A0A4U8YRG1_9BACT|nr:serine protease [Desulfoluna butyratoxydans]VFQ46886.1 peptidase s1 pa clan [Desulfoluna butyratoxydans]